MGKFEKGNKYSNGRPKGSTNKISKNIREFSALLLEQELETLKAKLPTLNDGDYLKAIAMLYKNVLPAQKQIEQTEPEHPLNFEIQIIDKLSDVTDKEVDAAIDNYVIGQRNK
jgi:hypothetical protein